MLITPNIYRALEMRKSVSAQYDLEQRDHFEQARISGGQYEGVRQCNGGGRDEFERFLNGPFQRQ